MHLSVEMFTVLNEAEKKKGERIKRQALRPYPIFVFFFHVNKKTKTLFWNRTKKQAFKSYRFFIIIKKIEKKKKKKQVVLFSYM